MDLNRRELIRQFYHDAVKQYLDYSFDYTSRIQRPLVLYSSTSVERFCFKLAFLLNKKQKKKIKIVRLEEIANLDDKETLIVWADSLKVDKNGVFPKLPFEHYAIDISYFRHKSDTWSKPIGMSSEEWAKIVRKKRE